MRIDGVLNAVKITVDDVPIKVAYRQMYYLERVADGISGSGLHGASFREVELCRIIPDSEVKTAIEGIIVYQTLLNLVAVTGTNCHLVNSGSRAQHARFLAVAIIVFHFLCALGDFVLGV